MPAWNFHNLFLIFHLILCNFFRIFNNTPNRQRHLENSAYQVVPWKDKNHAYCYVWKKEILCKLHIYY